MKYRIPILLAVLLAAQFACLTTAAPTQEPTRPVSTVNPQEVLLLFTDPARITDNLTDILTEWGVPDPVVAVDGGQVSITCTQPRGLLPSDYREFYLLLFASAERAAPFSTAIQLTIRIDGEPVLHMQASTADVAGLRRGEITTNDFLDRLVVTLPEGWEG